MNVYLDTHVAIWLAHDGSMPGRNAREALITHSPVISPIVLMELQLMEELQRISSVQETIDRLRKDIALEICPLPFGQVVASARALAWTRDPFDRLITGHAAVSGAPLITKDRHIRRYYPHAIW